MIPFFYGQTINNIFFNDFAGSGRSNNNDTSSHIVIKDSNLGSHNITVRRNVFLNWEGSTGSNFILIGEDRTILRPKMFWLKII